MTGFWLLLALYACLWALLLAPGVAVLLLRQPDVPLPDDDPVDEAWVLRMRRELEAQAPVEPVKPEDVPITARLPRRREPTGTAGTVLRVRGTLVVPDGGVVTASLIVEGDLHCEGGSRVSGPSWVRGKVRLGPGSRTASLISDRDVHLAERAVVDGGVAAAGPVVLTGAGAEVTGPALSRAEVVLKPETKVGAALAPVVRCEPEPDHEEIVPVSDAEPLVPPRWTPEMDEALVDLWAEGRLAQLVEALAERTGVAVRGAHVMSRARELGLYHRGIPRPPAVLGRRPRWVLDPETVRVGADLRVPPGVIVSYAMVVEGSMEVYQDAQLERPIRAGRGILLHARAVCFGQAVSDGLIVLEEGAAVLGPIDSSTHILLFSNAKAGVPGFGGGHARGAIGLEPGAVIVGGAVAGLGIRGEPPRPMPQRVATVEALPDVSEIRRPGTTSKRRRRGRRRRKARATRQRGTAQVEVLEVEE